MKFFKTAINNSLCIIALLMVSVTSEPLQADFENRHQFQVNAGHNWLEVIYKEFLFSYQIKKKSSRRGEKKNKKKIYEIQFFYHDPQSNIPQPIGSPLIVVFALGTSGGRGGRVTTSLYNRAAKTYVQTRRGPTDIFSSRPFHGSINTCRNGRINWRERCGSTVSSSTFSIDYGWDPVLQRTADMPENRKLPYRRGNFALDREIVLINPQFIHVLASLMQQFSSDDPKIRFQAALLICYLWGDQEGFPNMFQSFLVAQLNPFGEFQLHAVSNQNIDLVHVLVNQAQGHYVNYVDFNQPFPPLLGGWTPESQALVQTTGTEEADSDDEVNDESEHSAPVAAPASIFQTWVPPEKQIFLAGVVLFYLYLTVAGLF